MNTPSFLTQEEWSATSQRLGLSERERQIVCSMIEGHSELETARLLGMSVHTVHTHLERLHRKLHVANRPHLVGRVLEAYAGVVRERTPIARAVVGSADS